MENIIDYNDFINEGKYTRDHQRSFSDKIKYLRGVSEENKNLALDLQKEYSNASKGRIFGLKLHPDLSKKIREGKYPNGFDMGIDKDGFFIHTHRARSKSYPSPKSISVRDIRFIDSTG